MKRLMMTTAVCAALGALADAPYPMSPETAAANRAAVTKAAEGAPWKGAKLAACAVEAMSGVRRTADLLPDDADFAGPLKVLAAGDEYESASLMLFGFEDVKDVLVTPSDLVCGKERLPAAEIEVKTVKVWYEQGTAWGSFFSDPVRRIATPELLLFDDSLVEVDFVRKENFLRCQYGSGSAYRWMSFNPRDVDHSKVGQVDLRWVRDATTLQPVLVRKNEFKQLMVCFHVSKGTKGGLYEGRLAVSAGGKKAFDFPVMLRVLGFDLPKPAAFRDVNRPYVAAAYMGKGHFTVQGNPKMLRNCARHNMVNYLMNPIQTPRDAEALKRELAAAGMDTDYLFGALPYCGVRTSYPARDTDANWLGYQNQLYAISNTVAAVRGAFGPGTKTYAYGVDEGSAWTVRAERSTWKGVHERGGNVIVATKYHPYLLFNLDFAVIPRQPRAGRRHQADALHEGYPDTLVGWYADPHSGPENPDFTRRIYGWQTWRNNYDGFMQYILFRDNWNDFWVPNEGSLRGLMLVYPQADDLVDTIEWEGLREGVDDVRYGTYLKQLIERGLKSKDVDALYAARAAGTWLSQVDCERSSLKYLRWETVRRIENLTKLLAKEGK